MLLRNDLGRANCGVLPAPGVRLSPGGARLKRHWGVDAASAIGRLQRRLWADCWITLTIAYDSAATSRRQIAAHSPLCYRNLGSPLCELTWRTLQSCGLWSGSWAWIPWELVIPLHVISRRKTPNNAVTPQHRPNMTIDHLAKLRGGGLQPPPDPPSPTPMINKYKECKAMTSFREFMWGGGGVPAFPINSDIYWASMHFTSCFGRGRI